MGNNIEVVLEFKSAKTLRKDLTPKELKEKNVKELIKYILDKEWKGEDFEIARWMQREINMYGDSSLYIAIKNGDGYRVLRHDENLEKYAQDSNKNEIILKFDISRGCPG